MDQFQIQFQKEGENPESFDLADLEKTSILWCQYSHLFYLIFFFRKGTKKMKETIPIKSTPISLTSAMNVTNSPIQQIMQPSQCSINTSLQQTVLYH